MTATGSHFDFDSLRGAPLARNDIVLFGHFAILRQLHLHGFESGCGIKNKGTRKGCPSACRETRLHITQQPGFWHIRRRKCGKSRDGAGRSTPMLPAFSGSWQQTSAKGTLSPLETSANRALSPLLETPSQRNCCPFGIPARFEMSTHNGKMLCGHSFQNEKFPGHHPLRR